MSRPASGAGRRGHCALGGCGTMVEAGRGARTRSLVGMATRCGASVSAASASCTRIEAISLPITSVRGGRCLCEFLCIVLLATTLICMWLVDACRTRVLAHMRSLACSALRVARTHDAFTAFLKCSAAATRTGSSVFPSCTTCTQRKCEKRSSHVLQLQLCERQHRVVQASLASHSSPDRHVAGTSAQECRAQVPVIIHAVAAYAGSLAVATKVLSTRRAAVKMQDWARAD